MIAAHRSADHDAVAHHRTVDQGEPRAHDRVAAPCQPIDGRALRGCHPRRRGSHRRRRAARRPDRQAHRSLAPGQVHRRRALEPRPRSGGARSTGRSARRTTTGLRARLMDYVAERAAVRPGLLHRRRCRTTAGRCASTPRPPGRASSPATSSAGRPPRDLAGFEPNFTIINVPSFQADPGDRGHAHRDGDPASTSQRMEIIIVGTEYAGRDQEVARSRS